jgi:hypothetical protein
MKELRAAGASHLFPDWYSQGQQAKVQANQCGDGKAPAPTMNQYYPRFLPRHINRTFLPKIEVKRRGKDFYCDVTYSQYGDTDVGDVAKRQRERRPVCRDNRPDNGFSMCGRHASAQPLRPLALWRRLPSGAPSRVSCRD